MQQYLKEPFASLSHLCGAALAFVGLVGLIDASKNSQLLLVSITYGTTLVLVFLASSLTHGPYCSERLSHQLEKCDYAAIFLVIAGTYTPLCVLSVGGRLGWNLLITEWLFALVGVWNVFYGRQRQKAVQVGIYLTMGWLFIFVLEPMRSILSAELVAWLIGGALAYSVGSIVFLSNWPHLWKGRFHAHDLWHVFVLVGSTCHYVVIEQLVSKGVIPA